MGQCFSAPAVGSVHGRETEQKYRAKWNDIGYENDQRQRIKANISGGVTATTADIGMYGGRGEKSGCLSDDHDGLATIDEHGSLRVSSPLKEQRKHPASPMRNAVVHMRSSGLSKPSDSSKMSYAAVVTKDSKHTLAEGGQSGTRAKDQVPRNWTCGDLLGQGAFGSVYLGLDNDTGRLMAVKQVSLGHAGGASSAKVAEHIRSLESEVDTLKLLDHPNIVRYIGTERNAKLINIFLEFVPGGSIASLLTNFGPFKEPVVKMYTKQILLGLEYLHNNGIMHRDIKGANILVENTGLVKLADFGASKKIEDLVTIGSGANSVKGTPYWMAPEVITQTGHGRKADIWSVACTVIEMATGKPPWSQYGSQVSAMFHIAKSKGPPLIPQDLSPECKDFLYLCFNRNWRERPSATTLLDHPFLANVNCPRVHVSEQPRCSEQRVSKTSQENYVTSEGATRDLNPHQGDRSTKITSNFTAVSEGGPGCSYNLDDGRSDGVKKVSGARRKLQLDSALSSGIVKADSVATQSFPCPERKSLSRSSESSLSSKRSNGCSGFTEKNKLSCARSGASASSSEVPDQSSRELVVSSGEQCAHLENHQISQASQDDLKIVSASDETEKSRHNSCGTAFTSGGSFASFNPVEEPEGIHQQARSAIDSLKASMPLANEKTWDKSNKMMAPSRGMSLQASRCLESCVESGNRSSKATNQTSTSSGTVKSQGPIVYTVAADSSNDFSIPVLPWDASQSWTTSSRPSHPSGAGSSNGNSHGDPEVSQRRLNQSLGSTSKEWSNSTMTKTASVISGRELLETQLSGSKSSSPSSSHTSKTSNNSYRRSRSSSGSHGQDMNASGMGMREFQTPRKMYPRSAASTPGFTPSRIPKPPLPDRSPRTLDMVPASAAMTPRRSLPATPSRSLRQSPSTQRRSTVGPYEHQHLKQLERKRFVATPARSMGPPPPMNATNTDRKSMVAASIGALTSPSKPTLNDSRPNSNV
ncbi:hypothetical protein M9434_002655 [Picochlorum sp. BPE23]|nr:hypothetical protein M9434_002655 [Picochlorum sp. BPE23]